MKRFPLLSAVTVGVAVSACGSLEPDAGSAPVLATLQGNLENPQSLQVTGAVRVAVVWKTFEPGKFNVAEDLPVQPVFPSSFTVTLGGPPPAEAMLMGTIGKGSSSVRGASGVVVAYSDLNGNGRLDLVPSGASAYVDRIVATNDEVSVLYVEGAITGGLADPAGRLPAQGYNLVRSPKCDLVQRWARDAGSTCKTAPGPDGGGCESGGWLPISTPFALTVASSPEVVSLMCLDGSAVSSSSGGAAPPTPPSSVQPAQYPDPCDPGLVCSFDGSSYIDTTCSTVKEGLCQGAVQSCASVSYARPTPAPAGWPCVH